MRALRAIVTVTVLLPPLLAGACSGSDSNGGGGLLGRVQGSPTAAPAATPSPSPRVTPVTPSPQPTALPSPTPTPLPTVSPRPSASASPVATAVSSPQGLLQALLGTPFTAAELPPGFSSPQLQSSDPGDGPRQFRALGGAGIELRGPDTGDGILYIVYPTAADARGRFDRAGPTEGNTLTSTFTPAGFTAPARCLTGLTTSNGVRGGTTVCIVLVDNVEVWGISQVRGDAQRGNNDSAIALAQAGLFHLQRLTGGR